MTVAAYVRAVSAAADAGIDGRAATLVAPGRVELREIAHRPLAANELRIRVEGSGICASNIPAWQGRDWFQYPLAPGAPGHEGWGVVEESNGSIEVGTRVAYLSGNAFATHDITTGDAVVAIPDGFGDFPGEAIGCAMNAFRRSDVRAGQTVAIVGIGFLGAILTRLAERAGARVIAISRRAFSLDLARQYGAHEAIAMDDHWQIVEKVKQLTGGEGCERVIECVGLQWPLDLATELTRIRGRLIVAGYHQDGPRQVNLQLWNWRGLDVVNAHERENAAYVEGMRDAVRAVAGGMLDLAPLLTHRVALDEIAKGFELLQSRPDGFVKALVVNR
ncbi:MAG TPA: zinc-binding dehydrogenase [Thermoanaerobaculia bacterium]|jgi:threonine dehydrogenase-like Zn-dependent dehydrogenase